MILKTKLTKIIVQPRDSLSSNYNTQIEICIDISAEQRMQVQNDCPLKLYLETERTKNVFKEK